MSDKTITGVVTWLRNWFYTKSEVDSLVTTGGTSISIEDTDFFDVLDCINTNFNKFNDNILYAPLLNGNESLESLISGYELTAIDGICGGYHQVGYVADGFDNSGDWELSMTLKTSYWDGGFALLLNPYTSSDFDGCTQSGKWDCIYNNTNRDMLQWIDGTIKINNGGLQSIGISYTRDTTMSVKFIKNGTSLSYYENDNLKGTYNWDKLATAPRVYLGVFTWGSSNSVNTFSNVIVEKKE